MSSNREEGAKSASAMGVQSEADYARERIAAAEVTLRERALHTPWDEAPLELKLEKLRMDLRDMRRWLPRSIAQVEGQVALLMRHQHGGHGEVLVSAQEVPSSGHSNLASAARDPLA